MLYAAEVIRYGIGFLLFFAALGKLKTLDQFKHNLTESFGLSRKLRQALAPTIIFSELLISFLVFINNPITYLAMGAALLMFLLFTGVVAYQYVKEGIVKCSCFGEAERSVSPFDLLRNGLLIAAIAYYLLRADSSTLALPLHVLAAALGLIVSIIAIEFHAIATLLFRSE